MPTASQKIMNAAMSSEFQARIRLALVRTALAAIDDENSVRSAFARKVLTGKADLYSAAIAVVANASIGASVAAEETPTEAFGVNDADIAYTIAEGDNPAVGVFNKLAIANAGI